MKYVMDLNQFMFLKDQASKNDQIKTFAPATQTDGIIETHDVKLTYHYDGSALQYVVSQRYTLAAHIASDSFIEKHVDQIITSVLATEPAVIADVNKENK